MCVRRESLTVCLFTFFTLDWREGEWGWACFLFPLGAGPQLRAMPLHLGLERELCFLRSLGCHLSTPTTPTLGLAKWPEELAYCWGACGVGGMTEAGIQKFGELVAPVDGGGSLAPCSASGLPSWAGGAVTHALNSCLPGDCRL